MARMTIAKPQLLYLFLCEGFQQEPSGKKTFSGTFDQISSTALPCTLPHFFIVTGWKGHDGDAVVRVSIEAPEGVSQKVVYSSPPVGMRFQMPLYRADAILEVSNPKFTADGVYYVHVFLGTGTRQPILSYPLLVQKVPEVPGSAAKVAS